MLTKKYKIIPLIIAFVVIYIFVLLKNTQTNKTLTLSLDCDYEEEYSFSFENQLEDMYYVPSNEQSYNNSTSSYIGPDFVYTHMFKKDSINNIFKVEVSGFIYCVNEPKNLSASLGLNKGEENILWEVDNITDQLNKGEWKKFNSIFFINQSKILYKNNLTLQVFTYNNSKDEFYLDDLEIKICYKDFHN